MKFRKKFAPKRSKITAAAKTHGPNSFEIAVLAALTAINENLLQPTGKKKPTDCLSAVYELLREVDEDYLSRFLAEQMNKLARRTQTHREEVYTFKQVLQIQPVSPTTASAVPYPGTAKSSRIKSEKEFGKAFIRESDLNHRRAGTTMVGGIGTEKGLRNAITRLFDTEDTIRIIRGRELTISEIDRILQDQIKRNRGRIRAVRTTKEYPT